jgi:sugar phosphate isomerase/epimerase
MLALHTFTTRPWNIHECIAHYAKAGVSGISIWRETIEGSDLAEVRRQLDSSGLTPISLVRGGFFTATSQADRDRALDTNRLAIAEAHALGLPSLVLVCGATPGQTPQQNYGQIREAIATLAPEAQAAGVRLLVEPLHPMYAGDRSAIASLKAANDLCQELAHPNVGIALDVYHVWWDLDLPAEIARCAAGGWLDAYHICDFRPQLEDPLLDRGLMGEGCINLPYIDSLMLANGWSGLREVEIFSRRWWSTDQHLFLAKIIAAHAEIYGLKP